MPINKVILAGNLTRDPELKTTGTGAQVLEYGIAVSRRAPGGEPGEWEDRPNYFDCTMFGDRAEALSHHLSKGMKVAIEGELRYSSWEKDGERRSKVDIVVHELEFMSRRERSAGND